MANTTGPQLPDFLRPAAPANGSQQVHDLQLTPRGKVRRRTPWYRRPLLGCAKPTDLLALAVLLAAAAYITADLRSTGRQPMPTPQQAPATKATAAPGAATSSTTYANGLGTGP